MATAVTSNKYHKAEKYLKWLTVSSAIFFFVLWFWRLGDSLWSDEAFTGIILSLSPHEIVSTIMNENNPPLYYLIVYPFKLLFGNSELVLRLPSLFFALATFGLLRFELRARPVEKELASIFFLLNSNLLYMATEARYYALLTLLYMATFMVVRRLRTDPSTRLKFGYIVLSTLLLYSHSLGLILFALNTIILFWPELRLLKNKFNLKQILAMLTNQAFTLVPMLFYVPWIFVLVRQISSQQALDFWLSFHPLVSLKYILVILWNPGVNQGKIYEVMMSNSPMLIAISAIVALLVLIFVGFALKKSYQSQWRDYLLPFGSVVLMYGVSFYFPVFFGRYFSFLLPFTAILIARGLYVLATEYSLRWALTAAGVTAFSFFGFTGLFFTYSAKMPMKAARDSLVLDEATIVTTDDEYQYLACLYYFPECKILQNIEEIDENIGVSLFPQIQTLDKVPTAIDRVYLLSNIRYTGNSNERLEKFELNDCVEYGTDVQFAEHLSVCTYLRVSD